MLRGRTAVKVLFISLDTLRADRLSCITRQWALTPNIDRLARDGALFTQAIAGDIPTQPSHTALFTGQFGLTNGIVSHFFPPAQLDTETAWLPSMLQDKGYLTGAVDHLFVMKDWFIRGYQDYMAPPGRSRSPASQINEMAFPWIAEHAADDFFLFLHYWDAHIPYVPPSPYKEWLTARFTVSSDPATLDKLQARPSYPLFKRNLYDFLGDIPNLDYVAGLYDAEVAYLDHELGRLFGHLESLGILDDTLCVLFGDHGENMTEHEAWFDHAGLYDSIVHVPLVIYCPGKVPPARVDTMVQLVDVMPTVLELLGLPEPDGLDGRSLLPLARGDDRWDRPIAFLSECTWEAKRGLRTRGWKYIRSYDSGIYPAAESELYDLTADPAEQTNLAQVRPDVARHFDDKLRTWLEGRLNGRPDPFDEVVRAGLPAVLRLEGVVREDEAARLTAAARGMEGSLAG